MFLILRGLEVGREGSRPAVWPSVDCRRPATTGRGSTAIIYCAKRGPPPPPAHELNKEVLFLETGSGGHRLEFTGLPSGSCKLSLSQQTGRQTQGLAQAPSGFWAKMEPNSVAAPLLSPEAAALKLHRFVSPSASRPPGPAAHGAARSRRFRLLLCLQHCRRKRLRRQRV